MATSTISRLALLMDRISKAEDRGLYSEFLRYEGDRKVTNPDTGNTVKLKSLRGEKGQKVLKSEFDKWKGKREERKEQTKKERERKEREEEQQFQKEIRTKWERAVEKIGPEEAWKRLGLPGKPPKDERTEDEKLRDRVHRLVQQHGGVDELMKKLKI